MAKEMETTSWSSTSGTTSSGPELQGLPDQTTVQCVLPCLIVGVAGSIGICVLFTLLLLCLVSQVFR